MNTPLIIGAVYIAAAICFIAPLGKPGGLRGLRSGMFSADWGVLLLALGAFLLAHVTKRQGLVASLLGSLLGLPLALTVLFAGVSEAGGLRAFSPAAAIASAAVVAAIVSLDAATGSEAGKILAIVAVTAASVNLVSGFVTTDRMLKVFKRKGGK